MTESLVDAERHNRSTEACRPVTAVTVALCAVTVALCPGTAQAQDLGSRPEYHAEQFACASMRIQSDGSIETVIGGRTRRERVGWTGLLRLVGRPVVGGVGLVAWFEELRVRREGPEGTLEPDASGLLGGRFRGVLDPAGGYRAERSPYVPDAVAEVVRLGDLPEDLWPRPAPIGLTVGRTWRDSVGRSVTRLPDSVSADGASLRRFRSRGEGRAVVTLPRLVEDDSAVVRATELTRDDHYFVWHAARGLLRADRRLTVETTVPPTPSLGGSLQSRLEQRVVLQREAAGDCRVEG